MKIYIETDMTELPKGCKFCDNNISNHCPAREKAAQGTIKQLDKLLHGWRKPPSWCPLRTETEIADKAKEDNNAKQF